jgi:hypothetical protein
MIIDGEATEFQRCYFCGLWSDTLRRQTRAGWKWWCLGCLRLPKGDSRVTAWRSCDAPGCKGPMGKIKRGCLKCLESGFIEVLIQSPEDSAPKFLHDWRVYVPGAVEKALSLPEGGRLWICEKCAEVFQGDTPSVSGCDTGDYPGEVKLLTDGALSALNGNEVQSEV